MTIGSIILYGVLGFFASILIWMALNVVEQTERGLVTRFGKYKRFAEPGLTVIIPFVESLQRINITEMMVNADKQEIITKDNLNATVDAQVYFMVKSDEKNVKATQYNVYDYQRQIVSLARTTLRNIIGGMSLKDANSQRSRINEDLMKTLIEETKNWGIDVVRTELKEINPPMDVQNVMNKVVIAENEKIASVDFATAVETRADGERRAIIKVADGNRESKILEAQGQAEAIKLVNESANKYFIENAQTLKKLEVTESALKNSTKYVIDSKSNITNVICETAGVLPIPLKKSD